VVDYNAEELNQLWKWMSEQRLWDAPALIYGVAFYAPGYSRFL
jgi:hypothetical protein